MPRPLTSAIPWPAAILAALLAGMPGNAPAQARSAAAGGDTVSTGLLLDPCPRQPSAAARPSGDAARGRSPGADVADSSGARGGGAVDVAILASVSAASVTFASQPDVRVRLCGGIDSVRVVERRNLPERVVAGQTYRDVYVAVEILGRMDAACLAERLGVRPAAAARDSVARRDCAGVTVGAVGGTPERSP